MLPTTNVHSYTEQMQQSTPQIDPPPYEDCLDSDGDSDDEPESESDASLHQPLKLTINAASAIQGCNNMVQTPQQPPFADIAKLSAALMHAMNQMSASNNTPTSTRVRRQRTMRLDLTINCGIAVCGDRNVVGTIGLRQKAAATATPASSITETPNVEVATAGAKRKADDPPEADAEPLSKKVAVGLKE